MARPSAGLNCVCVCVQPTTSVTMEGVKPPARSRHSGLIVPLQSFVLGFVLGCTVLYLCTNLLPWCSTYGRTNPTTAATAPPRIPYTAAEIQATEYVGTPVSLASDFQSTAQDGNRCQHGPLKVAVLILSNPKGLARRHAIRSTWLHHGRVNTALNKMSSWFLVGTRNLSMDRVKELKQEKDSFHDMLFLPDLLDSYENLTLKVLLGLKSIFHTLDFEYVVKTDDDSYVRVDEIFRSIRKMSCEDRLYWGYFNGAAHPLSSGKWAEKNWFLCPQYLPYAMGGGYVLSRRVVGMVVRVWDRLQVYRNEDVTMASWLAPYRLVKRHDVRFNVEGFSRGCNNNYVITHKERVKGLYEKYLGLLKNGTMCSHEFTSRHAYNYNWTAPASRCCDRTQNVAIKDEFIPDMNVLPLQ